LNNMNIDDYTVKDVLKTLIVVLNSLRDGETRKLNSNEVLDLLKDNIKVIKNFILIFLQLVGMFFFYGALGILLHWGFSINLPCPANLKNEEYFAKGFFILLPIIGFFTIKFGTRKIYKILGYVYIVGWVTILIRTLVILLSRKSLSNFYFAIQD